MSDRITNADVPRLLREMSRNAALFADDAAHTVHCCKNIYGYESSVAKLRELGEQAEDIRDFEERRRARAIVRGLFLMLDQRYEIVDRWGKHG